MFVQSLRGALIRASYPASRRIRERRKPGLPVRESRFGKTVTNPSWAAYRRAFYRARTGGGIEIEIRVGKRTPALDELLGQEGKRRWIFVTACNPGARRLGAAENRARTDALESSLKRRGFLFFEGRSGADAGEWPEEAGFLVVGVARLWPS